MGFASFAMTHTCLTYRTCKIEPGLAGLTAEQIELAYAEAGKQKISIRDSILKLGLATETELLKAVAERDGFSFINLTVADIETDAINIVSAQTASHYHIIPVKLIDQVLWIATCDPFYPDLKGELELVLDNPYQIKFILAPYESIKQTIRKCYGVGAATVERMVADEQIQDTASINEDLTDDTRVNEASVIKLVNQILADAIAAEATDIHFEPHENDFRVRYRIDGVLHDSGMPSTVRHFRDGITSRIKILSGLDIAEKRLPQDGRTQVLLTGQQYDLRVSVLPSRHGEAVNIRILPRGTMISDLPSLGIEQADVSLMTRLISKPHGILLVTGPPGSGKTTTLYTCLKMLNRVDNKIITIEDPVEYDMTGLVQMQVMSEIGFTFARALRSILRHDPDIILVGEIRDMETAETAIRTALTGHMVFSTLHTNSAASAVARLLDMGIEPFLIASSVEGILSQRLVRVICPHCKEECTPSVEIQVAVKSLMNDQSLPTVYRGRGCAKCRFTGYHGRTVIHELLVMSETIRNMTIDKRHAGDIEAQAFKEGMVSLVRCGIQKVHQGITTYEEVLRATKGLVEAG